MIEKVAIIGAGTMGHGIAQVSAAAGCDVILIDTTTELVERGIARVRENLDEGIKRGKQTAASAMPSWIACTRQPTSAPRCATAIWLLKQFPSVST